MIRRYRDSDWAAVYDVCVETADAGRSTRGRYRTDDLVPDVFAGPYLFLEPEHAYVLDDGNVIRDGRTDSLVGDGRTLEEALEAWGAL